MQESVDWVNRVLREQITGIRVVRAFVREDHERARFADANTQYTGTALAVGRLMALVFPHRHAHLQRLDRGGAVVRRPPRRERPDADRRAHRLHELPHADPHVRHDGDLHVDDDPARDGVGRAHRRGARHRLHRGPAARPRWPSRAAGHGVELRDVEFTLPRRGCRLCCKGSRSPPSRARPRPSSAAPAPASPRCCPSSRGSTTSPAARSAIGGVDVREAALEDVWSRIGLVPQKPYLFTGTVASNLRYGDADGDRRRAVGGAADRPGRGLRARHAGGPGLADRPGRHQRLRRPAAAPGHRPGPGGQARDLPVRRQLLGPRPVHRREAARRR